MERKKGIMKIAVVNGLLTNEEEMKRILELVVHEFDRYDLIFNYINLGEEKLDSYCGMANPKMDDIFNKILTADAVIFASSIHMGNITPLMQNFFNYFELTKYKAALQSKNVLPVLIHNTTDEIPAYSMMLNVFKRFNIDEVNKLFLSIPPVINDEYLDKTCKYIKNRTKEFAAILVPEKVEVKTVDTTKINEILNSKELTYDENQLTLDIGTKSETNIKEIAGMVNDKLKAKEIIKSESKIKDVTEITQKYKTKIEEIMQETLFGDDEPETNESADDNETVAERIFKSTKEEMFNHEKEDDTNAKIEKGSDESLDSLIARVVARTRQKDEEENLKREQERKEQERIRILEEEREKERARARELEMALEKERQKNEALAAPAPVAESVSNTNTNITSANSSSSYISDYNDEEFIKVVTHQDEDKLSKLISSQARDLKDELRNSLQAKANGTDMAEIASGNEEIKTSMASERMQTGTRMQMPSAESLERFEPESIKLLRQKLNGLKASKSEIENDVKELRNELSSEPSVVKVNKFELEDFAEPHEIIPFEEDEKVRSKSESKSQGMTLKDMTKNLIYLFKAPEDETMKALVQINVEGDEGFNLYLNILDNKCAAFDGVNMNNDLTIYVKDDKWRSILDGEVTLQRAFMTGLVKVTGNFMMLNKLDNTLLAYNK